MDKEHLNIQHFPGNTCLGHKCHPPEEMQWVYDTKLHSWGANCLSRIICHGDIFHPTLCIVNFCVPCSILLLFLQWLKGVSGVSQASSKEGQEVLLCCFKVALKVFQGCLNCVRRWFKDCFRGVSRMYLWCFKSFF